MKKKYRRLLKEYLLLGQMLLMQMGRKNGVLAKSTFGKHPHGIFYRTISKNIVQ